MEAYSHFGVCIAIYHLCVSIDTKHISFMNTAAAITLHGFSNNAVRVGVVLVVPVFSRSDDCRRAYYKLCACAAGFASELCSTLYRGVFRGFLPAGRALSLAWASILVFYTALIVLGLLSALKGKGAIIHSSCAIVGVGGFATLVVFSL